MYRSRVLHCLSENLRKCHVCEILFVEAKKEHSAT